LKDQDGYSQSVRWQIIASQTAMDTTIEAVQIHGGNGYVAEYHVERGDA
jgi:alkylation response protein AidB-like acyl-CoA dehydrogenase